MINNLLQHRLVEWFRGWLIPALLQRRTLRLVTIAVLLVTIYWGVLASDRYVSEAHIVIQKTDSGSGSVDLGSLLSGAGGSNRADQLLMRDLLLSQDMLNKLDAQLDLRTHYSGWGHDPLSALWFRNTSQEQFHQYFMKRVAVEFDDYAGVLVIKAQGYDAKTAHAITTALVEEGERAMNELVHKLAQDQVAFIEKQVKEAAEKMLLARAAVLKYQNSRGLISPQSAAENLMGTINRLEAQRTELQARRSTLLGYLSTKAPAVAELDMQLDAIEKQIKKEQARLTAPDGKTLNSAVEEFQRIELEAQFAQDVYKTALVSLEKSRVEATRTLKKVSILQTPTLPQYPLEPRRLYNITVSTLVILLLAGIVHLLAAIIRDHKD